MPNIITAFTIFLSHISEGASSISFDVLSFVLSRDKKDLSISSNSKRFLAKTILKYFTKKKVCIKRLKKTNIC